VNPSQGQIAASALGRSAANFHWLMARYENSQDEQSLGADHRQPAGIYYHSLVCMRGPAARRA
jgi:hypothetical protein